MEVLIGIGRQIWVIAAGRRKDIFIFSGGVNSYKGQDRTKF